VYDVQVAQALHAIACGNLFCDPVTGAPVKGRYSLDRCVKYVLGRDDAKARDDWRLRYALLDGVPLEDWPAAARQYPVDDAVNTLEVAVAQVVGAELKVGPTPGPHRNLELLSDEVETAFDLHLGAMWGLHVDALKVEALRGKTEEAHAAFVKRFREVGFYKLDKKTKEWKEDQAAVKRAVVLAYGGGKAPCPACVGGKTLSEKTGAAVNCKECSGTGMELGAVPRTPTDGVKANRDTLVESGDEDLIAYGANEAETVRDKYLPFLEPGATRPINLRPNVLVASLRTSYDGVIQQMPREGDVRGCIVARPGYVLGSFDFSALELCTLAQVTHWLFPGQSQMRETICATGDPGSLHTALAAGMAGITPEEMAGRVKSKDPVVKAEAKKDRQAAKALNFGLPGGMGAAKLVLSKRQKSEGSTELPDGTKVPGIRFCVLLLGAERCGVEKVTEWRDRPTPPICRACVELVDAELKPAWFRQWPEIKRYFDWVKSRTVDEGGDGEFPFFGTDGVRGGLGFCDGANNGFQSLGARVAKAAQRAVTRECYLGRRPDGSASPLLGTRPIFFTHDEVTGEIPVPRASDAAKRLARAMVEAGGVLVPDVPLVVEPTIMRAWDKNAEAVWKDGIVGGELLCWEDRDGQ
jgi:hypothetical protein